MTYREDKLAKARSGAATIGADPLVDSVYLAGSLTAGLGSPTSDIDVYAITAAGAPAGVTQVKSAGERLDVETYSSDWLASTLAQLDRWTSSRKAPRSDALSTEQLDVLIRMRDIEVVQDSPALARFRDKLARSEDQLRRLTLSTWALEANGHMSDMRGSHQDGDLESAALMGQSLLLCAAKAVAAAAGDLYFGTKWVHRQLRRSLGGKFPHEVFTQLQSGGWTAREPGTGLLELLTFQQTMMAGAQLLGWRSAAVTEWPRWLTGTGGYRRDPYYNVIHLTEGVLLNNELTRQFVIKPDVALVWALCDGADEDEIVAAAVALGGHVVEDGDEPIDEARARQLVATLEQRGLISRTAFR